jgi:co-chaperonin GroES (HSP10)
MTYRITYTFDTECGTQRAVATVDATSDADARFVLGQELAAKGVVDYAVIVVRDVTPTTEKVSAMDLVVGDLIWFSGYAGRIVRIGDDGKVYGAWTEYALAKGGTHWFTRTERHELTITRYLPAAAAKWVPLRGPVFC